MINNKSIAVVVPSYNEEKQIGMVIESMPDFVDRIIIVNDCSSDRTSEVVLSDLNSQFNYTNEIINTKFTIKRTRFNNAEMVAQEQQEKELSYFTESQVINSTEQDRIILINHLKNGGVGAAIASGYNWAKDHNIDCTAVMAGDGQMDPDELEDICLPVVNNNIDYVKGNRLIHRSALLVIPKIRFLGNSVLSILTKIASGYWHVSDTQTGYTAISKRGINSIRLHEIYNSYGMPNDMLVKLNIAMCTLKEVEIKPIYNVGEQSKMKISKVIPTISLLLLRSFFKRLYFKYLFRDFHPLFLLYHLAFILTLFAAPLGIDLFFSMFIEGISFTDQKLLIFSFLLITAFQSLLFAMWMDIQDNERLYKSE